MNKNIAVVYGGFSAEFKISVLSGQYIASIIDKNLFNVYEIIIEKEKWYEAKTNILIDKSDFSIQKNRKKIFFDAVVIEIHGDPGENGILQSYFDLLNIPYTTCNAFSAAFTFSKYHCLNFLRNFNIKIADSVMLKKYENYSEKLNNFLKNNTLPFFIKPNAGGSSFGTTKVTKKAQIKPAINDAFNHSKNILLEEYIDGVELTCGVFKTNKIKPLTPIEVRSKTDFFDYDAKYNSALNEEIIPATVDQRITDRCKELSKYLYEILDCKGLVRMDFILKNNQLYFLESNSVPGMTSESLVPKMLRYDKINITDLFTQLINIAIEENK